MMQLKVQAVFPAAAQTLINSTHRFEVDIHGICFAKFLFEKEFHNDLEI